MSNYRKNKWIIEGRLRRLVGKEGASWLVASAPSPLLLALRGVNRRSRDRYPNPLTASLQAEGGPGQEDGPSRVGDHRAGGWTAPAQLPPDRGHGAGDGGGGGDPGAEIPPGGGGGVLRALLGGAEVGVSPSGVSSLTDPSLPQADTSASSVPELERQIEKLAKVSVGGGGLGFSLSGGLQPPHHPSTLPTEADVLPKEAAPFLPDPACGLPGPGPVPEALLGPAPPGRHLRGGRGG